MVDPEDSVQGERAVADPEGFPRFPLKPPFDIASMRMCIKRGRGCYCAHAHETPLSKPWGGGGG